ncbi:MAG: class II glutamine amidotransferase [Thermoplasmata archaeon]
MCRLLCIATRGIIPHQAMASFKRLSREGRERPGEPGGHRTGWGAAYFPGGALRMVRELGDAFSSVRYDELTHMTGSNPEVKLLVAHLWRAPSKELASGPLARERVAPFVGIDREGNSWVFAFDGRIGASREGGRPFAPSPEKEMDSQRVFRHILGRMPPPTGSPEDAAYAVAATLRELARGYSFDALNFALSDGRWIHLARFVEREESWNELHICKTPRALIGCSEPLKVEGWTWESLPSRAVLSFNDGLEVLEHKL